MGFSLSSLFLIIITLTHLFFQSQSITHWQDIEALKEFKNGLDPNSLSQGSCLSSWDFTVDPCDNLFTAKFTCGFRCDVVFQGNSRVTELALDQAGYTGSLSSGSWNLPFLQTLDISGNFISGSIPNSLSNLIRLQRLSFSGNSLSGSIPDSVGSFSELQELNLDNNYFQGTIPLSLNGLKNLKRLEIQRNRLSGSFPNLGQLSTLYFLDASDNIISGDLPSKFPANLVELSLRGNQFEGNIPSNLPASLVYLQVMDLSHNRLSGSVPWTIFAHPNLQQVTLSYNQIGSVQSPGDSGQNSGLIAMDLSNNEIRGFLPGFLGSMPRLSALSLENNMLSGMIPIEYALKLAGPGHGVDPFERLLLGGNYLFGAIPGPLMGLKPGSVMVQLGDNCLYRCPLRYFFCQGGGQKSLDECKSFGPMIP